MSQTLKDRMEKIQELINKLIAESQKGIPIIVEGKKDIESLRELCVEGAIILAKNSRKSIIDLCSYVEEQGIREVILLLDFDRKGIELTKRLRQYFEKSRVKPNLYFWVELRSLAGKELKDIEGLSTYMKTLKKKCEIRKV